MAKNKKPVETNSEPTPKVKSARQIEKDRELIFTRQGTARRYQAIVELYGEGQKIQVEHQDDSTSEIMEMMKEKHYTWDIDTASWVKA